MRSGADEVCLKLGAMVSPAPGATTFSVTGTDWPATSKVFRATAETDSGPMAVVGTERTVSTCRESTAGFGRHTTSDE